MLSNMQCFLCKSR